MGKPGNLHPVLFAILPVLSVYAHNQGLVSIDQVWLPLAIAAVLSLLVWLGGYFAFKRDRTKAGVFTSICMLSFFSYGYFFKFLGFLSLAGVELAQHKYVFPAWACLLALTGLFLLRTRKNLLRCSDFLGLVAVALTVFSMAKIAAQPAGGGVLGAGLHIDNGENDGSGTAGTAADIYYIILDGCSRADVLKETYQLDISGFIARLEERGFFVAGQSTSNYSQTYLSLASSLNFNYLDGLVAQVGPDSDNRLPLRRMIQDNQVVSFLRKRGYVFISFASGMNFTEIKTADRYMAGQQTLSEFDNLLLNLTPVPALVNKLFFNASNYQYDAHRSRILYALEHLEDVARIEAPTFTFVHLLACHPPYVFGEHGEAVQSRRDFSLEDGNFFIQQAGREAYRASYRQQLRFILDQLEKAIDEIIADSEAGPILILQADHGGGSSLDFESLAGTDLQERMPILNAYCLPGDGRAHLYAAITPVNTFRVILNAYFGAGLELLEDRNFYSTLSRPYQLTEVTRRIKP